MVFLKPLGILSY